MDWLNFCKPLVLDFNVLLVYLFTVKSYKETIFIHIDDENVERNINFYRMNRFEKHMKCTFVHTF